MRVTRAIQSAGQEAFKALEGKPAGLSVAFGVTRMVENMAKAIFGKNYILLKYITLDITKFIYINYFLQLNLVIIYIMIFISYFK